MTELYIYYRVHNVRQELAKSSVLAMQARLMSTLPGLRARLLSTTDTMNPTWMEIYTHPQGISATMQAAIADAGRELGLDGAGARHVEVFEPCV